MDHRWNRGAVVVGQAEDPCYHVDGHREGEAAHEVGSTERRERCRSPRRPRAGRARLPRREELGPERGRTRARDSPCSGSSIATIVRPSSGPIASAPIDEEKVSWSRSATSTSSYPRTLTTGTGAVRWGRSIGSGHSSVTECCCRAAARCGYGIEGRTGLGLIGLDGVVELERVELARKVDGRSDHSLTRLRWFPSPTQPKPSERRPLLELGTLGPR